VTNNNLILTFFYIRRGHSVPGAKVTDETLQLFKTLSIRTAKKFIPSSCMRQFRY